MFSRLRPGLLAPAALGFRVRGRVQTSVSVSMCRVAVLGGSLHQLPLSQSSQSGKMVMASRQKNPPPPSTRLRITASYRELNKNAIIFSIFVVSIFPINLYPKFCTFSYNYTFAVQLKIPVTNTAAYKFLVEIIETFFGYENRTSMTMNVSAILIFVIVKP